MSIDTALRNLATVTDTTRTANMADHDRLVAIAGYYDDRMRWPERAPGAPDNTALHNSIVAEISAALASTCLVVDGLLNLFWRMRAGVRDAFAAGELTLTKVRVIANHISGVPAATVSALEPDIIAAARILAPGPLGIEIDRLVLAAIADWDAEARKNAARMNTGVRVTKMRHGLKKLTVVLSAAEATEVENRIHDAQKVLCPKDSSTMGQRQAKAFMSVVRGTAPRCDCGDCNSQPHPVSRHLTLITMDLEKIVGLMAPSPYLHGYGPIDDATAARLASDGTWRAIFTAARRFLTGITGNADATERFLARAHRQANRDSHRWRRTREARVVVGRTRNLRPGYLPKLTDSRRPRSLVPAALSVERWRQRLAMSGQDWLGQFPDGHGGFVDPPPGALTYRPGAALIDLVRSTYPTCVHPGCSVPSSRCDLDHTVAFDHDDPVGGGWTIDTNLAPLCRRHHNMKTDALWFYERLADGTIHAIDPLGNHYFTPCDR